METIEIQCGSCNQMMALLVEHLGTQVHCPHCEAVVQTPAPETFAAQTHPTEADTQDLPTSPEHGESIFSDPEKEDVFDSEGPQPKIQMPEREDEPAQRVLSASATSGAPTHSTRVPDLSVEKSGSQAIQSAPAREKRGDFVDAPADHEEDHLGFRGESQAVTQAVKPRKRSLLIPTLLIFLVPYSIVATGFIIMLIINRSNSVPEDPMQRIPDPEPAPKNKKGPPRRITRVQHDSPLPHHLLTTLRQPIRVGDIEVTPLDVLKMPSGSLALRFKARNLAQNVAFIPVSPSFLKLAARDEVGKPYTFLHNKDLSRRIYGGDLEYQSRSGEVDLRTDGELLPGQEGFIQIETLDRFNANVNDLLRGGEKCIWRVQVRRGLVEVAGHSEPLSATAIIGVEFSPNEVIRDRKGS